MTERINNMMVTLEEKAMRVDSQAVWMIYSRFSVRVGAMINLVECFKAPKVVRKCIGDDMKRMARQLITGKLYA